MEQQIQKPLTTNPTLFPPIGSLFSASWHLFVSRLGRFFILWLIITVSFIVCLLIAGFTIFGSFLALAVVHGTKVTPPSVFVLIGGILVFIIVSIIISILYSTWLVLSMSEDQTQPFSVLFKKGFSFIIPMFVLGFLSFFIEFGGLLFLFIPFLIFAFFFCFAQYEVIVDKQNPIQALKRSYMIITRNFGDVFVRLLILLVLNIVLAIIPQVLNAIDHKAIIQVGLLMIVVNFFFNWYALCYSYTLYTQARQRTDFTKPASLIWAWIIALLGWILWILIFIGLTTALLQFAKSGELQKWMQQYQQQKNGKTIQQTPLIKSNPYGNQQTYIYPTTIPTIDYTTRLQQQQQQAQKLQQQMEQQYNQGVQQNNAQLQQALQQ